MHLSAYHKSWPWPDDPDYRLVYSTKNAATVLVPENDFREIEQGRIPAEHLETLVELGILVPDLEKERQEVSGMLAEINRLDPGINVAVVLGLACNFDCVYCYEGSMKDGRAMTPETADRLVGFLRQRLGQSGKQKLRLDFYGGEPLLYVDRIKAIAGPLKKIVESRGGDFRFSLVTNGSLLTPETVHQLLPFGLAGAKVTVDGPAAVHDSLRPFRDGRPSFGTIMANLHDCCDLVRIGFGGNYTRESWHLVGKLLDQALAMGLTPDRLGNVQFHPVQQTGDRFANPEFTGGCASVNEPWLAKAAIQVREQVLARGYRIPKMKPSPCMVDIDDAFTVNHDGAVYKCVAMIGHPQYRVGMLPDADLPRPPVRFDLTPYHPDHWRRHPACLACAYLPICFGGCRFTTFQQQDSMQEVDCQYNFFDRVLEATIMQENRAVH